MKNRITMLLLITALSISAFTACNSTESAGITLESSNVQHESDSGKLSESKQDYTALTFGDIDYDAKNYEQYNGAKVKIKGYMSSLSPLDGKFMYLMNIPYQNCPFCMPGTTEIESSVAVYAPDIRRFDFYDGPIEVTGTLNVGDTEDEFGYFYPFKIVDASYSKLDTSQLSENAKMYGALSQDGIITNIMGVVDQIHINAFFETYDDTTFDDVAKINDAEFDGIIKSITAISKTDYADLIFIVEELKAYNSVINNNLEAQEYFANTTDEMADSYYYLRDSLYEWLNRFKI